MWYIDDIRIYTQKYDGVDNQIVARLQPLNNLTVHHIFGKESEIITIDALVVGNTDLNALKSKVRDGNVHSITGNYNIFYNDIIIHSLKYSLLKIICQNIRPDLPENTPVYTVTMELYRNE